MRFMLLLFALYSSALYAQGRTSLDLFAATGFSQEYNSFLRSNGFLEGRQILQVFRAGAGATKVLGRHFHLRIGLQYAQYGFRFQDRLQINSPDQGDRRITFDQRHHYLETMVGLRYQIQTRGSWSPFVELGTNAAIFTHATAKTTVEPELTGLTIGDDNPDGELFNALSFVGRAGLGAEFLVSPRLALYTMVGFQHHLTKIHANPEARILPWQASVEVGGRIFID
ncbi:outer membrane beta-barrel protein [Lewinella sp. W8]|uniref:outer membrane beta-barrel protein n=1 Tax=Lewinella sp. W8 TaxID=2528208 RepID=UPI0010677133|nr:outer membrane beta-barrel protein [Lewinella sp. W8]MTB52462.1 outer membrane beta-barrel protein [Lewinella sp. W8]